MGLNVRIVNAAMAAATIGAAGCLALNQKIKYIPSVKAARTLLTGHSHDGRLHSVVLPGTTKLRLGPNRTWMYLPKGYAEHQLRRYPLLMLLHGSPGFSADWVSAGKIADLLDELIALRAIEPMIVVMPSMNGWLHWDTEGLNSTRGGPQVETYLMERVLPYIREHYRITADRLGHTIGGFSAGAYAALNLSLHHSEMFANVIGLAPFKSPGFGGKIMLKHRSQQRQRDIVEYLPGHQVAGLLRIVLASGEKDTVADLREAQELARSLKEHGQDVHQKVYPDHGHSWAFARQSLADALMQLHNQPRQPAEQVAALEWLTVQQAATSEVEVVLEEHMLYDAVTPSDDTAAADRVGGTGLVSEATADHSADSGSDKQS